MSLKKREALKNVKHTRTATVNVGASSVDNTLSFTFISRDNAGSRYDWNKDQYYTEFLDVSGAKTTNLKTFFKDHHRSVDSATGSISNVRIQDGELIGDVTFGTDPDSQKVLAKYRENILTDVSIGYEIKEYRVDSGATNEQDIVTVTNFEIFEVSAVGLGFDSGAKKRENDMGGSKMNEELKARLLELEAKSKRSADEVTELAKLIAVRDAEQAKSEKEEAVRLKKELAELKRQSAIQAVCRENDDVDEEMSKRYLEDTKLTADELKREILTMRVNETKPLRVKMSDTKEDLRKALIDGIALRVGAKLEDAHADAEKYRYASLTTIASLLIPEDQRSFNPVEIAERSMVTGDFPLLLLGVGNRVLTNEYDAQPNTAQLWVGQTDVTDFRINNELTVGQGGRLSKTKENGDLEELSMSEKKETWKLGTFGNKFVLTREMIVNDDLNAFTNMLTNFAVMGARTFNGLSYDMLRQVGDYATYKMADGTIVYSSNHGNKTSTALSADAISVARKAMRKQKGIDDKTPLNIVPKFLIVGAGLEQTAKEILNSTAKISANNAGVVNVHQNSMQLVVDAELNDTEWYMVADRRTIKVGFLAGTNRRPIVKMNDSSLSRTSFEGLFDIGLVVEDYRGLFQGNQ